VRVFPDYGGVLVDHREERERAAVLGADPAADPAGATTASDEADDDLAMADWFGLRTVLVGADPEAGYEPERRVDDFAAVPALLADLP
jgi:hypothetical protein